MEGYVLLRFKGLSAGQDWDRWDGKSIHLTVLRVYALSSPYRMVALWGPAIESSLLSETDHCCGLVDLWLWSHPLENLPGFSCGYYHFLIQLHTIGGGVDTKEKCQWPWSFYNALLNKVCNFTTKVLGLQNDVGFIFFRPNQLATLYFLGQIAYETCQTQPLHVTRVGVRHKIPTLSLPVGDNLAAIIDIDLAALYPIHSHI